MKDQELAGWESGKIPYLLPKSLNFLVRLFCQTNHLNVSQEESHKKTEK